MKMPKSCRISYRKLMEPTLSVEKEQVTETYTNELVLDTARFRWINEKRKGKDYFDLSIGLNDLTFNKLKNLVCIFISILALEKKTLIPKDTA